MAVPGAWILVVASVALAAPVRAGERSVSGEPTFFTSPGGVKEACILITRAPGGVYYAEDEAVERAYCALDFYGRATALCPKTWSTSPATVLYDVASGPFAGDPAGFEKSACPEGGSARKKAAGEHGFYEQSMNAADTSGTFVPASLVYYHLSRWLDARVSVPPAVFRTMDREAHRERVSVPGERLTAGHEPLRRIHAAWQHLAEAEADPSAAPDPDELFNQDRTQIFGVVLGEVGTRYGSEVNGTRERGWGTGQNLDFQETAPYLALRSDAPLGEAIDAALARVRQDASRAKALEGVGPEQMVLWMQELTEIVWLDFVLGQQDRVGNVDTVQEWAWVEDGRVLARRASRDEDPPPDLAGRDPVRVQRTWINDNDAALRTSYTNFARKTGMLENLRRVGLPIYRKALVLGADARADGPVSQWLRQSFGLSDAESDRALGHAREAADILRNACREGRLKLDLDPARFLAEGRGSDEVIDCDAP